MLSVMKTHIDSVAGHFKGKILEWDVLNEITDDGNGNALRNTFWKSAIGADYVDSAFTFSHRADPIGKLYYNEYGAEGMNGKSNAVYKLAQRLIASKIPIDGIGLQCHLGNGLNAKDISSNIKRLGELGLRVSMTEIDIKNGTSADWTNLLNACLENYNCVSFVAWGLDDAVSWLGSGCNCLLYDGQLAPKPPVQALIDALGKADPAVVEKRKAFLAGTSSIGFRNPMLRPSSRQTQKGYILNAASVPVFSGGVNMSVDILGRNRPIAPASPWEMGLSILP
jgi:endo-1,4-beta-xylanase